MVDNFSTNSNNISACFAYSATCEAEGTIGYSDHDRLLPVANVERVMRRILPSNAKISKEAKETMQECVSEFISFVTSEASNKCHVEKRKTLNGCDVCWSLSTLGFEDYGAALKRYLDRYREAEVRRRLMDGSTNQPVNFSGWTGWVVNSLSWVMWVKN